MSYPFLALHVSTTGPDPATCQITEIGIVSFDAPPEKNSVSGVRIVILHPHLHLPTNPEVGHFVKRLSFIYLEQVLARGRSWFCQDRLVARVSGADKPTTALDPIPDTWYCSPDTLAETIYSVLGELGLDPATRFMLAGLDIPTAEKFLRAAGAYKPLKVMQPTTDEEWKDLCYDNGMRKNFDFAANPTKEECVAWAKANIPPERFVEDWSFSHHARSFDPLVFWAEEGDQAPAELSLALKRAGISWHTSMTAMGSASQAGDLVVRGLHKLFRAPAAGEIPQTSEESSLSSHIPSETPENTG